MPKIHHFSVHPEIPPRLAGLEELALNLRWTWDSRAYKVFQHLDPEMLEKCEGNPVLMLRRISRERLEHAAGESAFLTHMDEALQNLHRYLQEPGWFRVAYPDRTDLSIAYFSMEYGLAACLPIYSGGLGVLSGDHLKASSGLDLPLAAVGLLYNKGHFTQRLDQEGWQYEEYRLHDVGTLPIRPVMAGEVWRASAAVGTAGVVEDGGAVAETASSEPLKVSVDIAGRTVWARVWKARWAASPSICLIAALPENDPAAQRITSELYGGGSEDRLAQELLLGIGGHARPEGAGCRTRRCATSTRATPSSPPWNACANSCTTEGLSFLEARQAAGAGTLFTTHTPVPAGFDLFPEVLIEEYMGELLKELGFDTE